ncbi:unnamed protein product [Diatraea saccharalis]|uniref:Carboxylic ester hydrolase n=1 Tax=Diatraea saccharalis TaxID=40085 RepID=A0A9P0C9F9_9NEOP|nr:unnamed protein product [Diatraea saccharalis]
MFTATLLEGNEDCLFLNVYTRTLLPTAKLPVIVFIHGGAFMSGSGNDDILGPRFLLQHDVILVTFNYRLDVLGFLCLDIPEVPGNAGLKDQVAALSWIQNNIEQFGGDASNITLGGESAGSSSVTYHLLSPTSKGLFHKAIAQSGVCLNDWSKGLNSTERAFKVGKILGKQTNNPYELLDFLQSVPATKLVGLTNKVKSSDETHRCLPIHFVPVVEKRFKNAEPFIDQEPLDMLLLNKVNEVPLLIGYNSHEGLISVNNMMKKVDVFEREPHYLVPREIFNKTSQSTVNVFGERIKEFYFKNGFREQSDAEKYLTDYHFAVCIYRFAFFYAASKQPVYFFRFSINSEMNAFKSLMGFDGVKGASHADDLFYLFDNVINKSKYEEQEKARELVFTATKLWTDFAKTG